jgi:hypothetical protein
MKPLSRRAMLRGALGTAISLPFLEAMVGRAWAGSFPKRFVVFYSPNGTVPDFFWPTGSGTSFQLSPILAPLAKHQQDLLVLGGIDMTSALAGPGDAHQKGTGQCLTCTELQEGDFAGDAGESAGWANNLSIDQHIANNIGADNTFRSLELGVAVQGSDVYSRISYSAPAQPLPPENSPYAAYDRLFSDALANPDDVARQKARRKAVLDSVRGDFDRLQSKLGASDREKLESHMVSLQTIRDRLDAPSLEFAGACEPLDQSEIVDPEVVANMATTGRLQMDLLAMALACDLTRVGSIMWGYSTADHVYDWVDSEITEGHHLLAHKGDEDTDKVAQNVEINTWFASQLAYFIQKLKEIPEGDGSVFDNTVILWTNEQSVGNNHDRTNMPYVLAGSAGGVLKTGQYIKQSSNVGHQRLMVTIMNALGVVGDEFGNPEYGTGPLTGLT